LSRYNIEVMNVPGHSAGHKAPHLTRLNQQRRTQNRPPHSQTKPSGASVSERNRQRNTINNPMCRPEVREKVASALRDRGEGKSYRKYHGRHEHRVVAEQMLNRPLRKGEVVHHIDGNKRNNAPENLLVLSSQAEHARLHFSQKVGDAQ
jgi:hypothetical protein